MRVPLWHIDGFLEILPNRTPVALDGQGRYYMSGIANAAPKNRDADRQSPFLFTYGPQYEVIPTGGTGTLGELRHP